MSEYVSVEMLKEHSRIDYSDCSDEYLAQLIDASESMLCRRLQVSDLATGKATDGTPMVRSGNLDPALVQAVLMLSAAAYENRESVNPVQMYMNPHFAMLTERWVNYKGDSDGSSSAEGGGEQDGTDAKAGGSVGVVGTSNS